MTQNITNLEAEVIDCITWNAQLSEQAFKIYSGMISDNQGYSDRMELLRQYVSKAKYNLETIEALSL